MLSITARITLLWAGLFVAGLVLFGLIAGLALVHLAQSSLDTQLISQARVTVNAIDERSGLPEIDSLSSRLGGFAIILVSPKGTRVVFGQPPARRVLAEVSLVPEETVATTVSDPAYRVASLHVPGFASERIAAIAYEEPVTETLNQLRGSFFVALIPILLVSVISGFALARRL